MNVPPAQATGCASFYRARSLSGADRRVGDLCGICTMRATGSFETQFTFAQTLTESAKLAGNCLLVISLPASGNRWLAAHLGGRRGGRRPAGREALIRLRNVIGRVEAAWRPATAEESFEIVRGACSSRSRAPSSSRRATYSATVGNMNDRCWSRTVAVRGMGSAPDLA